MNRRLARTVRWASGGLLAIALVLRLAPLRVPVTTDPGGAAEEVPVEPTEISDRRADAGRYSLVVDSSLFSPTRTPPPLRAAAGPAVAPDPGVRSTRPRLRLTGIVRGPDGIMALIDADPTIPGAEVYRVGDPVGSFYVLEEATDSTVRLVGPGAWRLLRLDPIPPSSP